MNSNDFNNNAVTSGTGKSFAEKVRSRKSVVMYELVPPATARSEDDIKKVISASAPLFERLAVDAINIPEVFEETRNGERCGQIIEKLEPRELSRFLFSAGINDIVINKPIVHRSWEVQERWLNETYHDFNLHNFVFVGGESSKNKYPGPSVVQAAREVSRTLSAKLPEIILGGITIPTRDNEAERVLRKSEAGLEFFTTQIIYEADFMKKFLSGYDKLCKDKNIKPKMIFLSFAPAASIKDIELLTWLGVNFSQANIDNLKKGWLGMGFRSVELCQNIFAEIIQFVKESGIEVPIGLNVGYINRHNFELSFVLLEKLSGIYRRSSKV